MSSIVVLLDGHITAEPGKWNAQLPAFNPSFMVYLTIKMAPLRVSTAWWCKQDYLRLISTYVGKKVLDICLFSEINTAQHFEVDSSLKTMELGQDIGGGALSSKHLHAVYSNVIYVGSGMKNFGY